MKNLLSHEVVSPGADTGVEVPIIVGVFWALDTLSFDSHVSQLAEAAALVPILVEIAHGHDDGVTGLGIAVVDSVVGAAIAGSVENVVSQIADAGQS